MTSTERVVSDKADGWPANIVGERLTRREAEVAWLVSQGLANKAVAAQLGVREGTVKIHLHNIYQKLRVSNRTALMLGVLADARLFAPGGRLCIATLEKALGRTASGSRDALEHDFTQRRSINGR